MKRLVRWMRGDVPALYILEHWKLGVLNAKTQIRLGKLGFDWRFKNLPRGENVYETVDNADQMMIDASGRAMVPKERLAMLVALFDSEQEWPLPYSAIGYLIIKEEVRARGGNILLRDALRILRRQPPAAIVGVPPLVNEITLRSYGYVVSPEEMPLLRYWAEHPETDRDESLAW